MEITFLSIWQYTFMQHAFIVGSVVAIVAGAIGYFVVLRRTSFAAHALADIGFTGAAGALLLGVNIMAGLFAGTIFGAMMIALLGKKAQSRDMEIGTILAFMLGLGVLFISLYAGGHAAAAYAILFGQILGVSTINVWITVGTGAAALVALGIIYRPLLFSSLDQDVAEAKGQKVQLLNIIFMLLMAVAISIAVQVVGALLIFALMVTPAAIGRRLSRRPARGMWIAVLVSLLVTWVGLILSFYFPYPVSFFITALVFLLYLAVRAVQALK